MSHTATCPACTQHTWSAARPIRGVRHCPQCHALIAHTKDGTRVVARQTWYRHGGVRQITASDRLYSVVHPADGAILCACCSQRTSILESIDGRITREHAETQDDGTVITKPELRKMRVQRGWNSDAATHTLTPDYDIVRMPRIIRGRICTACALQYRAVEIGTTVRRPTTIIGQFAHYNTAEQRSNAEQGLADWAHTGSMAWLGATALHTPGCPCPACIRVPLGELAMVRRAVAALAIHSAVEPRIDRIVRGPLRPYQLAPARRTRPTMPHYLACGAPEDSPLTGARPLYSNGRCLHGLTADTCTVCLDPSWRPGTAATHAMIIGGERLTPPTPDPPMPRQIKIRLTLVR